MVSTYLNINATKIYNKNKLLRDIMVVALTLNNSLSIQTHSVSKNCPTCSWTV